jgi:hypothetical protein
LNIGKVAVLSRRIPFIFIPNNWIFTLPSFRQHASFKV